MKAQLSQLPKPKHRRPMLIIALLTLSLALIAGCGTSSSTNSDSTNSTETEQAASNSSGSNEQERPPIINGNPFKSAGITEPQRFADVVYEVKMAAATDDAATIAKHVIYPMRVNNDGTSEEIKDAEQFIAQYDAIFTASVKKALAAQDIKELLTNSQGVMVGNGSIWFGTTTDDPQQYGIIAVNLVTPEKK